MQALERHIDRPLLLIWDRLPAHRSWLVQEFLRASQGRIEQVWLPAYAPELNPVEYVWAYWKQHELPNVCPKDYGDLSQDGSPHAAPCASSQTADSFFLEAGQTVF